MGCMDSELNFKITLSITLMHAWCMVIPRFKLLSWCNAKGDFKISLKLAIISEPLVVGYECLFIHFIEYIAQ